MANTKSSKKRILTNERNRLENRFYKGFIQKLTKRYGESLEIYKVSRTPENKEKVETILNLIYKLVDKATNKNILHKNNAARRKKNLFGQLKNI